MPSAPKTRRVKIFFFYNSEDVNELITFTELTAVDCTKLISKQLVVSKLIAMLVKKIIKLAPHSLVVKEQSA